MDIFKWKKLVSLMMVGMFFGSAVGPRAFADDDGKSEVPPKPAAAAKIEAPAPLTERERQLLDRLEQLEKRMAELEGKAQPAAPSSSEAPASHPAAVARVAAQPSGGGTTAGGEVANVVPSVAASTSPGTQERASKR